MANEKKKKSPKKKLLIAIGGLVILVAFICVLIVVIPQSKNTQESLNEVSAVSMADNEDVKADYQAFANRVDTTAGAKYYSDEIEGIYNLIETLDDVMDYYNEFLPLAIDVNKYAGPINTHLNNIKNIQKNLNAIMVDAKKDSTDGITHLQNFWIDYRETFNQQLKEYTSLFSLLNQTYHVSLGNAFAVNEASELVLNSVDDYMNVISNMINSLVEKNIKGSKETDYELGSLIAKIDGFGKFVDKHLTTNRYFIERYYFEGDANIEVLNMFYQSFGQENFVAVIESLEYSSDVLTVNYFTGQNLDSTKLAIAKIVKTFIKGDA
ncbi:MAG: hypothetical protein E7379_00215 [Clostridiales bacterium]|nr:hypothetical protein [Clostridiales bacterium]